jgi:hypothetical protein
MFSYAVRCIVFLGSAFIRLGLFLMSSASTMARLGLVDSVVFAGFLIILRVKRAFSMKQAKADRAQHAPIE